MWHGCLQEVRSTQTDRRVRKHARRTWSVSAATRYSRLKVLTGDLDEVGWQQQIGCILTVKRKRRTLNLDLVTTP